MSRLATPFSISWVINKLDQTHVMALVWEKCSVRGLGTSNAVFHILVAGTDGLSLIVRSTIWFSAMYRRGAPTVCQAPRAHRLDVIAHSVSTLVSHRALVRKSARTSTRTLPGRCPWPEPRLARIHGHGEIGLQYKERLPEQLNTVIANQSLSPSFIHLLLVNLRQYLAPLVLISVYPTVHHEAFILHRAGNGAADGGGTWQVQMQGQECEWSQLPLHQAPARLSSQTGS